MHIVIAECSVSYEGRGKTKLSRAIRMILVKRDGSISIHSDDRAYKPLNWMLPPCLITVELHSPSKDSKKPIQTWTVNSKTESIEIQIYRIISDDTHLLAEADPGLVRSWTEKHLQAWTAGHTEEVFGKGWSFISREYETTAGPVDLLVKDNHGRPVAVEIKRTAHMGAIDQVCRYVEALKQSDPEMKQVRGLVLALNIRPRALKLAKDRGIDTLEIPHHLYR